MPRTLDTDERPRFRLVHGGLTVFQEGVRVAFNLQGAEVTGKVRGLTEHEGEPYATVELYLDVRTRDLRRAGRSRHHE